MHDAYSNVGVELSQMKGFNESCSDTLPLGDISNSIRRGDVSKKNKEMYEIIFGGESIAKGQIAKFSRAYENLKDAQMELAARKVFAGFVATFLTINKGDTKEDIIEIFQKFLNYYNPKM